MYTICELLALLILHGISLVFLDRAVSLLVYFTWTTRDKIAILCLTTLYAIIVAKITLLEIEVGYRLWT